jgi:hypothetical protein
MSRLFRTNHQGTHEVEEATERVRIGETRRVRIVGDQVIESAPMREAATNQPPTTAGTDDAAEARHVREATEHRSDLAGLPSAIVAGGVTVPLVIGKVRRLPPIYEAWIKAEFDIDARAYAISEPAAPVYGAAAVESKAVFLNLCKLQPSCPMLVLATLGHEAAHVKGHHITPGDDVSEERECDGAAERIIIGSVLSANRKTAGPALDPQPCVECFRRPGGRCQQGEAGQGRVFAALERFTEIMGG